MFDDFNCQIIFETKHAELEIVDRWSHDHESMEWIQMADAWYVKSERLHTPMASNIASFKFKDQAESFAKTLGGQVVNHEALLHQD